MKKEKWIYQFTYYQPTTHFGKRYRERMSKHVVNQTAKKNLLEATDEELAKRANYMLLFSILGRPGETEHTEVRYYFNWDIVIDNKQKTIITMYINEDRKIPHVHLFGDRRTRKMVYDIWFKPKSKYSKAIIQTLRK